MFSSAADTVPSLSNSMTVTRAKQILIAEDNPDLRAIFSVVFERSHFDVRVAIDGREAIAALEDALPDVLLLDVNMPHISGIDVMTYVRRTTAGKRVKIIVVTGNYLIEQNAEVQLADLFLVKPVDVSTLAVFARRLLEG